MDPPPFARKHSRRRSKDKLVVRSEPSSARGGAVVSTGDLTEISAAAAAAAKATAEGAGPTPEQSQDFKNHPTIRRFRNEYSNWRRGATRGSSGELTNDRLSGRTVRTKQELLLYRDEIHSTCMRLFLKNSEEIQEVCYICQCNPKDIVPTCIFLSGGRRRTPARCAVSHR